MSTTTFDVISYVMSTTTFDVIPYVMLASVTTIEPFNPDFIFQNDTSVTTDTNAAAPYADILTTESTPAGCLVMNSAASSARNESQDLVSSATTALFTKIKGAVLVPAFVCLALPTNLLSLGVFYSQGLGHRVNACLFLLSLVDLLFVAFVFLLYIDNLQPGALSSDSTSYREVGPVTSFIIGSHLLGLYGLNWASRLVSTFIALDRCLCVVWPLRVRQLLGTRRTVILLLILGLIMVSGRIIINEKYSLRCVYDMATRAVITMSLTNEFYARNKQTFDFIDVTVYGLFFPVIFIMIVIVTTAITVAKLHQAVSFRIKAGNSSTAGTGQKAAAASLSQKEVALTRMLVYHSVQFVLLNLPNTAFRLTLLFVPELSSTGQLANFHYLMVGVGELFMVFHFATTFLVYFAAGSRYRQSAKRVLLGWLCCCSGLGWRSGGAAGGGGGDGERSRGRFSSTSKFWREESCTEGGSSGTWAGDVQLRKLP